MKIKHNISLKLFAYGKAKDRYQIRMRVTFNGQRMDFSTGCQINALEAWDEELERVCDGYKGSRGETAVAMNNELRNITDQMELSFRYYEATDIYPTPEQIKDRFEARLEGTTPKKPTEKDIRKAKEEKEVIDLFKVFDEFVAENGVKNSWTEASYEKFRSLKSDLKNYKKNLKFEDLNEKGLTGFVVYLRDKKKLNTPRVKKVDGVDRSREDEYGLRNSSIEKKLGFLKWFLKWAMLKGYNKTLDYQTFTPTLKTTQKKIIFLTREELDKFRKCQIPEGKNYLERVRDVFLFCCFTGLRHSDVYNLKRSDIKGDHIEITTIKTADSLSIELNKTSRVILKKYEDVPFKDDKALPVISNQQMNNYLKELCKLAGIDEEIRITTYRGNERKDEIKQKWQLVGTHTSRRTFVVNALSLGISPNVVMKWTGHSAYSAMKPYIDIVDSIKANAMTKFDELA